MKVKLPISFDAFLKNSASNPLDLRLSDDTIKRVPQIDNAPLFSRCIQCGSMINVVRLSPIKEKVKGTYIWNVGNTFCNGLLFRFY